MAKKYGVLLVVFLVLVSIGVWLFSKKEKETKSEEKLSLLSKSHLSTSLGWSNDLQTIVWNPKDQAYDIYFLQSVSADNIFGDEGQSWRHTQTKDFKTYSEQSTALESHGGDDHLGWKSAWTGSVFETTSQIAGLPKGTLVAYFSGLKKSDGSQAIWAVASEDNGKTYTKVLNDGKPILTADVSSNKTDFRDSYVFMNKGKLTMYVAEGSEIGVYQSPDGINWDKADTSSASKILSITFFQGRNWDGNAPIECPVLKTMSDSSGQDKQVLFFGAKDASQGETTGTYYILGHLDDNGLFVAESDVRRLDLGSDYYGANFTGSQSIQDVNTSLVSMAWVGNWNYTANGIHKDQTAKSSYLQGLGSYSLARELTLSANGIIEQAPILPKATKTDSKVMTLPNPWNDKSNSPYTLEKESGLPLENLMDKAKQPVSQTYDMTFSSDNSVYEGMIAIDVWQGSDYISIIYENTTGNLTVSGRASELDNGKNGQVASSYYYDGLLGDGKGYQVKIQESSEQSPKITMVTDKTSLELFFSNGQSYTLARFSSAQTQDVKIYTTSQDANESLRLSLRTNKVVNKGQ